MHASKALVCTFILASSIGLSSALANDPMHELAERYRAAVLASDTEALWKLLHPACRTDVNEIQEKHLHHRIKFVASRKPDTITSTVRVAEPDEHKLDPNFAGMMKLPVAATHTLVVDIEAKGQRAGARRPVALHEGVPYWLIPLLTPEAEKMMRERMAAENAPSEKPQ